jgi:hypothetical protein
MQKGILSLIITALFLFLFVSLSEQNYVKIYSQESEKQQNQELSNSPIVLTAKLIDNQYRWIGSNNQDNILDSNSWIFIKLHSVNVYRVLY